MRALLLGFGYTASFLKPALLQLESDCNVVTTSRKPGQDVVFDLMDETTWSRLPQVDVTFWSFPAKPLDQVQRFWQTQSQQLGQVIAVGTTGSFVTESEHQIVNERTPLDRAQERVQGETFLRENGAIVVHAAGIYGPGRNPISWVRRGLVGPSEKLLNVIHVLDLADLMVATLSEGQPGALYLAADGEPFTWKDLIESWQSAFDLKLPENPRFSSRPSKRVDPSATFQKLHFSPKVKNVKKGVEDLMKGEGHGDQAQ